ncbi:2899_t:CDS:2, partial [Funneliformis mosseae]
LPFFYPELNVNTDNYLDSNDKKGIKRYIRATSYLLSDSIDTFR